MEISAWSGQLAGTCEAKKLADNVHSIDDWLASINCFCESGFSLDDKGVCKDIDECENANKCGDVNAGFCMNTDGSYLCHCHHGFELTENVCQDIDECLNSNIHSCDTNEKCDNTIGGYKCVCEEDHKECEYNKQSLVSTYCMSNNSFCYEDFVRKDVVIDSSIHQPWIAQFAAKQSEEYKKLRGKVEDKISGTISTAAEQYSGTARVTDVIFSNPSGDRRKREVVEMSAQVHIEFKILNEQSVGFTDDKDDLVKRLKKELDTVTFFAFWSQWSEWEMCTTTCGEGRQGRERTCQKGLDDTSICAGQDKQSQTCQLKLCGKHVKQYLNF